MTTFTRKKILHMESSGFWYNGFSGRPCFPSTKDARIQDRKTRAGVRNKQAPTALARALPPLRTRNVGLSIASSRTDRNRTDRFIK